LALRHRIQIYTLGIHKFPFIVSTHIVSEAPWSRGSEESELRDIKYHSSLLASLLHFDEGMFATVLLAYSDENGGKRSSRESFAEGLCGY
jgi:hypothetical protein